MDRFDLTKEQCEKMLDVIGPALGYLSRLKRRIEDEAFPRDDKLREDVERAQGAMQDVRMTLHYLTCTESVGIKRPDRR